MHYIDSAGSSTDRARRVLGLITLLSILVFVAYWNAFSGFAYKRESSYFIAQSWLKNQGFTNGECKEREGEDRRRCLITKAVFKNVADRMGIHGREQLKQHLQIKSQLDEELKRLREHNKPYSVTLPVVGVSVDIGDLGLLAGISIVVLLVWLAYTINTEMRATSCALALAKEVGWIRYAYDLLMMKQVLTVVTNFDVLQGVRFPRGARFLSQVFSAAPKLFLVFPLIAQTFGLVVHIAYRTQIIGGQSLSELIADVSVLVVLWSVSLFLTVLVFSFAKQYDALWRSVHPS